MKTLRTLFTLAFSVAFALSVMTAMQSCSKDDDGGNVPWMKLTITCTQIETNSAYTRFDVLCTSDKSVCNSRKFFYVDTVPYSGIKDPDEHQWREGVNAKNSIEKFRPKENLNYSPYHEQEGEMVVIHPFNSGKRFYIGAYVVSGSVSHPDTVWSEPFIYDAPENPSIGATYKLTGLTANSATFTLKFSREVTSDEFEIIRLGLNYNNTEHIFKTLTPFEGKVNELMFTFDNLTPNTEYRSAGYFEVKEFEGTTYFPTRFFTTHSE